MQKLASGLLIAVYHFSMKYGFTIRLVFVLLGLLVCKVPSYVSESTELAEPIYFSLKGLLRGEDTLLNITPPPTRFVGRSVLRLHQNSLSRFRPVQSNDVIPKYSFDAKIVKERSAIEQMYSPEFKRQMLERYQNTIAPHEEIVNSPYRRATQWQEQRYQEQRHDMAMWTTREAINDRIRNLFSHADRDSGPVRVANAMKNISGGGEGIDFFHSAPSEEKQEAKKDKTTQEQAVAKKQEEEPSVPTRLKAKLNALHGHGQLDFTSQFVDSSLHMDLNTARTGLNPMDMNTMTADNDPFRLDMKKEFKKIEMSSNVKYGFEKKVISLNVAKKITNQISCVASSDQFMGGQRTSDGSKSQQALRMQYSLSF